MTTPTLRSNRNPRLSDFNTFGEQCLEAAKRETEAFITAIKTHPDTGHYLISFTGVSGVGKTFLSKCILGELKLNAWGCLEAVGEKIENNRLDRRTATYRDWRKVSDKLKGGEYDIVDSMEEPFLLVIDDVGADYDPNKMATSKLDRILRSRRSKWTVLTCNLFLYQIAEHLDQRIASYMIRDGNRVVEIDTKDYALRKI